MRAGLLRVVPALLFAPMFLSSQTPAAQSAVALSAASAAPVPSVPLESKSAAGSGVEGGDPAPALHRIGGAVSPPSLLHGVEPEFSKEARKAKFSGKVLVNLIVDANGMPQNVHILHGVGMGLDENALQAVRQYTFKPAMENGKPVPVELNVEVNFQVFDHPKIIHSVPAELTEEARRQNFRGTVGVQLDVDENGMPQNVRVVEGVGMGLDENAVKAVEQYRFKPTMSKGVPISVPAVVTVSFKK